MKNNFKIYKLFVLILGSVLPSSLVLAAMEYPTIAGITISSSTTAAEYILYFFNLAIAVGTFIAAVMIAMAGFDYVTAGGEPAKIESAKSKIRASLLGVAVLLGSYIILNIINPQLTQVKIDDISNQTIETTVVVPEGAGVYLYKETGFPAEGDSLVLTDSEPQLISDGFDENVKSIKFVNPEDFSFGAVLFTETDYRSDNGGYCSYLLSDISSMDTVQGEENNPAIGNDSLSSIIVFKTNSATAGVTFYTTIDCEKRSEDYCRKDDPDTPCPEEKESVCTVSGNSGFKNIAEACPDLRGDILSMSVNDAAVLLKSVDKSAGGRCQFFTPANNTCINTIKYSYVYKPEYMPQEDEKDKLIIKPVSFVVFPFVK